MNRALLLLPVLALMACGSARNAAPVGAADTLTSVTADSEATRTDDPTDEACVEDTSASERPDVVDRERRNPEPPEVDCSTPEALSEPMPGPMQR